MNETLRTVYRCPICQIGFCHPHPTTFTLIHRGHFVSATTMTSYVCDVCEYQRFDSVEVIKLRSLLGRQYPLKKVSFDSGLSQPASLDTGEPFSDVPKAKR